jgi:hypothetical protein
MTVLPPASSRSHRPRQVVRLVAASAVAVLGVTLGGVTAPWSTASAKPRPVKASRAVVEPQQTARQGLGGQLPPTARHGRITQVQPVESGLAVVGASWARGALAADDVVQIRVMRDGAWQPWEDMESDDDHGPDPSAPGAPAGATGGTAPFVVTGDKAQVRVVSADASVPEVSVDFIDPGDSPADGTVATTPPGSASAAASRPTIYSRAQWGADESIRTWGAQYGQAQMAFIHHTAGSNSYTSSQVPAIIRGIYVFHTLDRDWGDIGYNFLVDKFGRVWEGRYGGVDKAVVGAHALGYNSGSFGTSVMGEFTSTSPPAAVTTSLEKLIAWKFSLHGVPAYGTVSLNGTVFNRISGHRDANQTSCPGQRLYDRLGTIRAGVASRLGSQRPSTLSRSVDPGGTPDVLSYPGDVSAATMDGDGVVLRAASPQPVRQGRRIGRGWQVLDHIVLTPDFTGDGHADILAIDPRTRGVRVYSGNGRGGFSGVANRGGGWQVMTKLVAAGDRTGDGNADLLAVRRDGALVLYTGDGRGWVTGGRVIATGFEVMDSVVTAGDVTRDGRPDLLTVNQSTGRLYLYPGTADGGVGSRTVWGGGWQRLDQLVSGPDADLDGNVGDVMTRQADGRMRSYYADDTGRLTRVNTFGRGWDGLDNITSGADWDGDGVPDLVARVPSSGDLRVYAGTGERDYAGDPLPVTADLAGANLFRVVGDLDGDGLADAVARLSNGDLVGLRGRGDGRFDRLPARIGSGWQIFDLIEAVGDYTNDGVPDLIARTKGGEVRIYPMTASFGFPWQMVVATGWQGARSITGTGAVNADANADVVVLRTDGSVRVYRGTGPGALGEYEVRLTGQTDVTRLLGVGDLTGDGPADLLATSADGRLWIYAGDGKGGFRSARQPVRAPEQVGHVIG